LQPGRIENALKNILKKLDLFDSYKKHKALIVWERVCGSRVAAFSMAKKLTGDKLHVVVKDHIWASEMSMQEYEFLKRYSKILGKNIVNKIYFKADPSEFGKKKKNREDEEGFEHEKIELNEQERKKIDDVLTEIKDDKTRMLADTILTRTSKHEKWVLLHGGVRCFHCGVAIEKNETFCHICVRELEKLNAAKLRKEVERRPWISYAEAIKTINPISYSLFCDVKSAIIAEVEENITSMSSGNSSSIDAQGLKLEIITLAMLLSEKPPSQLKDEVVMETLPGWMYSFYKG
jgi:hypothetical protein